jgi:hypothetical protein
MQSSRRRQFAIRLAALAVIAIGVRAIVGQTGIGRAPGTYRGTSGTIRYGNTYVSDKWSVQTRSLPSQNRYRRMSDGYLPSENRGYRLARGPMTSAYNPYASPRRGSVRYSRVSAPPSNWGGSVRYAHAGSYGRAQPGSRSRSYGSGGAATRITSYPSRGSVRYGTY